MLQHLKTILENWKQEVQSMHLGLVTVDEQLKENAKQIKESALGHTQRQLRERRKKMRNMIKESEFKISGLCKALQEVEKVANKKPVNIKEFKVV
jgi:hypothetical protein